MNVYLLRHASAGTSRINPLVDAKRPLDKEGKRHCLTLGNALTALNLQFDLVISSPLKRAVQTASLVGTETGYEQRIILSEALAPSATYEDFDHLLFEYMHHDNILLVGHNPNLTQFVGRLVTGGRNSPRPADIRMRKGTIAKINIDGRKCNLQWLLEPKMVRLFYANSTRSSRRKTSRK